MSPFNCYSVRPLRPYFSFFAVQFRGCKFLKEMHESLLGEANKSILSACTKFFKSQDCKKILPQFAAGIRYNNAL